jgi:hypothetical protein
MRYNADHGRDCVLCFNSEEHEEPQAFTDQDLYQAITGAAYLLGSKRGTNVQTSAYGALSSDLNWLSMVADSRYQAARKAGR